MLKRFLKDNRGIFWVILVGTATIMIATVSWLVAVLVTSSFIDTMSTQATGPYTISLGETVRTQGAVVIVIIDAGMILWMFISAFIKERQEAPFQP
jgi:hypothetical protein